MLEQMKPLFQPAAQWAIDIVEAQHSKGLAKGAPPMDQHSLNFAAKVVEDALRAPFNQAIKSDGFLYTFIPGGCPDSGDSYQTVCHVSDLTSQK